MWSPVVTVGQELWLQNGVVSKWTLAVPINQELCEGLVLVVPACLKG